MEFKQTRQGYVDALIELAEEIPNMVVLDSDVGKATLTLQFEEKYPSRFFNCGVQEQNMLSAAAGMSLEGFIPFASTFGVFATCRAGDQLRDSIAYPKANVKLGITHCGLTVGGDGASHQANEDIAITRVFPNMTVLVPGDYEEAKMATKAAARMMGPVYLRFGRPKVPNFTTVKDGFNIGKGILLKEGLDVTIVATGHLVWESLEASTELEKKGISVEVINIHTIKPLDEDIILESVSKTGCLVSAEEHNIFGGLGESISRLITTKFPSPQEFIGTRDTFGESGAPSDLMNKYGLNSTSITKSVIDVIKRKR